jgi:SAM-dependent methyltransferase
MSNHQLRRRLFQALWSPQIKPMIERLPLLRRVYSGWNRHHPFDSANGVDASGYLAAAECAGDSPLAAQINPYGGSQPSIVRAILASLPDSKRYAFVDIGCGKGRPLVVASEFPYQRIVGIDLAPELIALASENAEVIAALHPERTPIELQTGDATTIETPADCVVYFMYNSFHRSLVAALVAHLEVQLQGRLQHAFFVYYNPVHAEVFDASPSFARWAAKTIPYASDELGFGPDIEDTLVVWQSLPARYPSQPGALRRVEVSPSQWCRLVPERTPALH